MWHRCQRLVVEENQQNMELMENQQHQQHTESGLSSLATAAAAATIKDNCENDLGTVGIMTQEEEAFSTQDPKDASQEPNAAHGFCFTKDRDVDTVHQETHL